MSAGQIQFSDADRERIRVAVQAAEANTSAEIVPVIAAASGRYDRAEDIVGVWLGLLFLGLAWALYPPLENDVHSWADRSAYLQLVTYLVSFLIGFMGGAWLASRATQLRFLFTPAQQMRDETAQRARSLFYDQRVHHTRDATGLLIYLSLYERQAMVLADQLIVEKIGQPAVDELCNQLTTSLTQTDTISALERCIAAAGTVLAQPLPRESDDRNELTDALVVLE